MGLSAGQIGGIGGAISGLFGFLGDSAEASAYDTAAKYADQNAVIAREAGDIKLEQTGRQVYKTLGAQAAQYAGAGLTGSGSAQSVLRDSIHQGALEKAIVNEQAQINVTGYEAQAAQFRGMAQAAQAAGGGGLLGGIFGAVASFIP